MEIEWRFECAGGDDKQPVAMQQHINYVNTLRALGRDVDQLAIRDGPRVLGQAVVIVRRFRGIGRVAFVPRGPIWRHSLSPNARTSGLQCLANSFRKIGINAALVIPEDSKDMSAARGFINVQTPQYFAEWEISLPGDQRRAALSQSWRNALTRAETSDVKVEMCPASPVGLNSLLKSVEKDRTTKRYRALPDAFARAWLESNAKSVWIARATLQNETIAETLYLGHGEAATYHAGWSGKKGRQWNAHRLCLWHASEYFFERGVKRLDLGSLDTSAARELARFKLGTGAEAVATGGTWFRGPGTTAIWDLRRGIFLPDDGSIGKIAEPRLPE